jgi:hypothetical protein
VCNCVQSGPVCRLRFRTALNFFLAGPDLIRWNLDVVDSAGGARHVRLTMQYPRGAIVEYFKTTEMALDRERELEDLLIAARGFGGTTTIECAQ